MRLSSINHYGIMAATCCFLCYFIEKQKRADNPRSLLVCGLSALRLCVRHSYYYLILTMIITLKNTPEIVLWLSYFLTTKAVF